MPFLQQIGASSWLRTVIDENRRGQNKGLFSVCSAHPRVLIAAMRHAMDAGSMLSIESTSNQVNQYGGYTGFTPSTFVSYLRSLAKQTGLPSERILLGGDHLGPYPWRSEPSETAMEKACELVRCCILAGYTKIHLDASMSCGDDPLVLDDDTVAERAALLGSVAEAARKDLAEGSPAPMYVIGTEVPVPGGEEQSAEGPVPTSPEHVQATLASFQRGFLARGLDDAWERVIGLVVQSGAEFGDTNIFEYKSETTRALRDELPASPELLYEAHSTDYQNPSALKRMVEDHFGILKVGPWLTYAFREAIFALAAIEREWLVARDHVRLSSVREALESAMLRNPVYWKSYYGERNAAAQSFARQFSYSDRCRYYWPEAKVQEQVDQLIANLSREPIPLTLISQYLPEQYDRIRAGEISARPLDLAEQHIRKVLRFYSDACGKVP